MPNVVKLKIASIKLVNVRIYTFTYLYMVNFQTDNYFHLFYSSAYPIMLNKLHKYGTYCQIHKLTISPTQPKTKFTTLKLQVKITSNRDQS